MGLNLPTPSITPGPTWASELNTALTAVDAHNHTSGQGIQVPSAGININSDLSFQGYNGVDFNSTRFDSLGSPLSAGTDIGCVYVVNGDLYYNNSIGQQIQITAAGALNATSIGGIGGDYGTSTASVFYQSVNQTFYFWQNTNQSANLDIGPVTIRGTGASAFGVKLIPSGAMAGNYSLTFPAALPASTSLITVGSSGTMGYGTPDGTTTQIVSQVLSVKNGYYSREFSANGTYTAGNGVDGYFIFPVNATIVSVWIVSETAGSAGTTEFDLKLATSGGAFATILSTTGKVTSAAASGVWTDSGAVIGAQTGVTKPVLSTTSVNAGQALRFDILQVMTSGKDCRVIVYYVQR
jgi:hypothetical protein